MSRVCEAVGDSIRRIGRNDRPGVLAVSGGADSVALFRACVEHSLPVTVTHVNHGLRGAESDGDESFVRNLAERFHCPFRSLRATMPEGENLEAAGRSARYRFFETVARDTGAAWIATAHTADDQAETVLHRLLRGTGLRGLRGISEAHDLFPGCRLVRPLLKATRTDLLLYLKSIHQDYRTDSSNADRTFTRNRIRHDLLPQLATYNPGIVDVLNRLAEQARDEFAVIERLTGELIARAEKPRAGTMIVLNRAVLAAADPYLVCELFRSIWQREGWPQGAMTQAHWHRLSELVAGDYPDGVSLALTVKTVVLHRRENAQP